MNTLTLVILSLFTPAVMLYVWHYLSTIYLVSGNPNTNASTAPLDLQAWVLNSVDDNGWSHCLCGSDLGHELPKVGDGNHMDAEYAICQRIVTFIDPHQVDLSFDMDRPNVGFKLEVFDWLHSLMQWSSFVLELTKHAEVSRVRELGDSEISSVRDLIRSVRSQQELCDEHFTVVTNTVLNNVVPEFLQDCVICAQCGCASKRSHHSSPVARLIGAQTVDVAKAIVTQYMTKWVHNVSAALKSMAYETGRHNPWDCIDHFYRGDKWEFVVDCLPMGPLAQSQEEE